MPDGFRKTVTRALSGHRKPRHALVLYTPDGVMRPGHVPSWVIDESNKWQALDRVTKTVHLAISIASKCQRAFPTFIYYFYSIIFYQLLSSQWFPLFYPSASFSPASDGSFELLESLFM